MKHTTPTLILTALINWIAGLPSTAFLDGVLSHQQLGTDHGHGVDPDG